MRDCDVPALLALVWGAGRQMLVMTGRFWLLFLDQVFTLVLTSTHQPAAATTITVTYPVLAIKGNTIIRAEPIPRLHWTGQDRKVNVIHYL